MHVVVFLIVFLMTTVSCVAYLICKLLGAYKYVNLMGWMTEEPISSYLPEIVRGKKGRSSMEIKFSILNLDQQLSYLLTEYVPPQDQRAPVRARGKLWSSAVIPKHFMSINAGAALKSQCSPWVYGLPHQCGLSTGHSALGNVHLLPHGLSSGLQGNAHPSAGCCSHPPDLGATRLFFTLFFLTAGQHFARS